MPVVTAVPLTAEQQKRYAAGAEIYKNICLGCHQEDGRGKEKLGANLVGSAYVTAADPTAPIRILLSGKEGPIGLMPPLGPAMNDEQIASILTFVRRSFGHTAPAVDPLNVMEVRGLTRSSQQAVDRSRIAAGARARRWWWGPWWGRARRRGRACRTGCACACGAGGRSRPRRGDSVIRNRSTLRNGGRAAFRPGGLAG